MLFRSHINQRLIRQGLSDGAQHRQTTDPRIKDTDGTSQIGDLGVILGVRSPHIRGVNHEMTILVFR